METMDSLCYKSLDLIVRDISFSIIKFLLFQTWFMSSRRQIELRRTEAKNVFSNKNSWYSFWLSKFKLNRGMRYDSYENRKVQKFACGKIWMNLNFVTHLIQGKVDRRSMYCPNHSDRFSSIQQKMDIERKECKLCGGSKLIIICWLWS